MPQGKYGHFTSTTCVFIYQSCENVFSAKNMSKKYLSGAHFFLFFLKEHTLCQTGNINKSQTKNAFLLVMTFSLLIGIKIITDPDCDDLMVKVIKGGIVEAAKIFPLFTKTQVSSLGCFSLAHRKDWSCHDGSCLSSHLNATLQSFQALLKK